jgi:hypothetical protein
MSRGAAPAGGFAVSLFGKKWTPGEADEWTVHDWIAVIVSPLIYVLLTLGVMLSMLLVKAGFFLLASAIVLLVLLVRVINPKLDAISEGYEKRQKEYIEELERKVKWED